MSHADATHEREMPFSEHLEELRWHLLRSLLYIVVGGAVAWHWYDPLYELISTPIVRAFEQAGLQAQIAYLDVMEPLFVRLQVCAVVGILGSLPLLLWEVWRFVAPGLYVHERRYAGPLLPFSIVLALAGVALVYYALPIAFRFLLQFQPPEGDAVIMQHVQRYLFFLLRMMVAAALTFQMPIVMMLLARLELVTARALLRFWRHAVLICFALAAVITPTIDPVNMSIIAVPLVLLYFLSVVLVWGIERGRPTVAVEPAAEPPAEATPPEPSPTPIASTPLDQPAISPVPTVVDRSILGPLARPDDADEADEARFDPDGAG